VQFGNEIVLVDTVFACVHMKVTDTVSFSQSTITDYQMIVSKDLIIKSFDTGFQLSVCLSKGLIIKPQKLNYQINQYPKKNLIVSLGIRTRNSGW
jgi:hypothetical protein